MVLFLGDGDSSAETLVVDFSSVFLAGDLATLVFLVLFRGEAFFFGVVTTLGTFPFTSLAGDEAFFLLAFMGDKDTFLRFTTTSAVIGPCASFLAFRVTLFLGGDSLLEVATTLAASFPCASLLVFLVVLFLEGEALGVITMLESSFAFLADDLASRGSFVLFRGEGDSLKGVTTSAVIFLFADRTGVAGFWETSVPLVLFALLFGETLI